MRTVAVTRIGSLRDRDESTRGRIGIVDLPAHPLGSEDVRIRVAYAAICGSDPHLAEGFFGTEVPIGLGHEISGVVEAVGDGVRTGVKVGDRVAGNFLRFCGSCRACRDGRQQFCDNIQDYNRPGMAETVTWHESQVYVLPDSVSLLDGCLLEPVSVAVRIADKTNVRPGDRVLVCGGGPIGQLALQVMKMYGATSLTLVEPIAERRAMALRSGADHVIDPIGESQATRVAQITDGLGYDVVIDASGSTHAVRGLLDLADYLYLKELTLTGVFVSPYAFPRALQILPRLRLSEFTEAVFDFDDAVGAFEAHVSGRHPKVVIRCNDVDDRIRA
jgi:(R,R)-butanediol dehydrogenase/meso-butanediol dehydrogenase/diacetyl reductase/L-iditol 2-dehydrogenase